MNTTTTTKATNRRRRAPRTRQTDRRDAIGLLSMLAALLTLATPSDAAEPPAGHDAMTPACRELFASLPVEYQETVVQVIWIAARAGRNDPPGTHAPAEMFTPEQWRHTEPGKRGAR